MAEKIPSRYRLYLREGVPAEAALKKDADSAGVRSAAYLRSAAILGNTLLSAGVRCLEDGTLLIPTEGGVSVAITAEAMVATLQRGLAVSRPASSVSAPAVTAPAPPPPAVANAAAEAEPVVGQVESRPPPKPAPTPAIAVATGQDGGTLPPDSLGASSAPAGFVDDRTPEEVEADQVRLQQDIARSLGMGIGIPLDA